MNQDIQAKLERPLEEKLAILSQEKADRQSQIGVKQAEFEASIQTLLDEIRDIEAYEASLTPVPLDVPQAVAEGVTE